MIAPSGTWYEWLAVSMLQSAYRANSFQPTDTWVQPRIGEISAYIIALGQLAYQATDKVLYDLDEWTSKGFAYDWVEAMDAVVRSFSGEISWVSAASWVNWNSQEALLLNQLPRR